MGDEAGEDDALGGVDAGNGADDTVFEANDHVSGVVVEELGVGGFFFVRTRIVRMGRIFRCCVAPTGLRVMCGLGDLPTLRFTLCGVTERQPL